MSQYYDHDLQFEAAADLVAHRLVKLTGDRTVNYLAEADDLDDPIGVTMHDVDSGDMVFVRDIKAAGTLMVTAAGEIASVNTLVAPAADGKVDAVGTTESEKVIGRAIETASGDGAIIEARLNTRIDTRDLS